MFARVEVHSNGIRLPKQKQAPVTPVRRFRAAIHSQYFKERLSIKHGGLSKTEVAARGRAGEGREVRETVHGSGKELPKEEGTNSQRERGREGGSRKVLYDRKEIGPREVDRCSRLVDEAESTSMRKRREGELETCRIENGKPVTRKG
ncbi:hypothetical protein KM043_009154 [Ampulex compressa]|nr:hypothetical protein KM043_009154 [Ampulex compressa]